MTRKTVFALITHWAGGSLTMCSSVTHLFHAQHEEGRDCGEVEVVEVDLTLVLVEVDLALDFSSSGLFSKGAMIHGRQLPQWLFLSGGMATVLLSSVQHGSREEESVSVSVSVSVSIPVPMLPWL